MNPRPLILASSSPRRVALLEQIGIDCTIRPVVVDETPHDEEQAADFALRLALTKVRTCRQTLGRDAEQCLILGADTVVVCDGRMLGKPVDRADGMAMLATLSGRRHEVVTAVALSDHSGQERTTTSRSWVDICTITSAEAAAYWDTGEPHDKAGAYALQGLGAIFIERIEGSCSGIIGLPLHETARMLSEYGHPALAGIGRGR